ncbi:MAG: hypothetical protein OXC19_20315, partial [Bryobacterales bacterium]|nr:hypothetical protein [Bryobacterales bacterium]
SQGPCTKPPPGTRGAVLRTGRNRRATLLEATSLVLLDDFKRMGSTVLCTEQRDRGASWCGPNQ